MYQARVLPFFIRISASVFLLLLLSSLVQGQATPDGGSGPLAPNLVKNVDEVSIDFVVRNKKMATLGLKPEDVVVTDNGAEVKLKDLHLVTQQTGANHLVTLLFDPLDPSGATNAREVAAKILKLVPVEDFSFSVFSIDQRLRLFQEFTTDRGKILQGIHVATDDSGPSRTEAAGRAEKSLISAVQSGRGNASKNPGDAAIKKAMLASLTESRRTVQDQHSQAGLAGLLALVQGQTAVRGRKLVIYFTDGLRPDADAQDTLRSIAAAADRAEVSIYVINKDAVDTKLMDGLAQSQAMGALATYNHFNPPPTGPAAQQPTAFTGGMIPQVNDQITRVEGEGLAGNGDPLSQLALHTGGAYLFSEDNLKKPFRQAVDDLTTYFEASYVPPSQVYDGKFHQIAVKPTHHGLKVQARAGYFAVPPVAGGAFETPLLKIFSEQNLPAQLAFQAAVLQLGTLPTGDENTLVVEVPLSALETRSDPNANLLSWHVSIVSQIKDKSGAVVEHFSEDIPGHAALDLKDAQEGATMQRHFALPPGEYTVETAVADHNSGRLGGKRVQFQVPDTSSGLFLSDIAMVRRIDPFPEELDPFEPLRYQEGKVVPSLARQVAPGTKQSSFFFLVHADPAAAEPATLEMQVMRNGELMGQMPLQLPKDLGDLFPYVASLKTSSMPAGNYDVTLSLTQGGKVTERQASFIIPGAQLAEAKTAKEQPAGTSQASANVSDSDPGPSEIATIRREPLSITSLPAESAVRPSDEELNTILDGALQNALNYTAKLPNFACLELTDRSVDSSGNGKWRRKDSFGELLRYIDNHETRKTVEVNGHAAAMERADMSGPLSLGEFGVLLSAVFRPSSKAEFHWKETNALGNGRVQVFEYRVDPKNDSMALTDSSKRIYTGYHGVVFIDSATFGIRRITMEAEGVPADFSIHATSITVDYDYLTVGTHDYLMPVRGTIRVQRGRHEVDLNQIVFQNYRRYASQAKIIIPPDAARDNTKQPR
jgi:VWFA-related protein